MGAEGFLRAGDRKTAAQIDSRVKKAPVPAEYLCLREISLLDLDMGRWIALQSRRWKTDTVIGFDKHARKESLNQWGFCELHFFVNYKHLLVAFPGPHF